MTRHALLLTVLLLGMPALAAAQSQPDVSASVVSVIESVEIVGLSRDDLSPGLRGDIDALAGTTLDRDLLARMATRIDAEQPQVAASVRDVALPDGRVRIIFVATRISEDAALAANINTRYPVERVDISGVDEERISAGLRSEMQALVGRPLEDNETDTISARIAAELPGYDVGHRVSRGDETGRVRVTFVVRRSESSWWIPFARNTSKLVYHADQGWSGVFDVPFGGDSNRLSFGLVAGNADDLVEEYGGYSFRFESREAGTRRIGVSLELSRYTQDWRSQTLEALAADPTQPLPYAKRVTVTPAITVALTRHLRVSAGVTSSQLDALPASEWTGGLLAPEMPADMRVTATLAGVAFNQAWQREDKPRHAVNAGYDWQSSSSGLGSDVAYDRHSGVVSYWVSGRNTGFGAEFRAGYISGDAPLFARFTLGDTQTLRGWDKYAIAPAGAERMVHQSVTFRYRDLIYFVDAGSVWNPGDERKVRLSTGIGLVTKGSFITVGVPINADSVSGRLMLGIRASVSFDAEWLR